MRVPGTVSNMNVRNKNIAGAAVGDIRRLRGLSQDQLSGQLAKHGVSIDRAGISKLENGSRGILDYELKALATILKVPVDRLLKGTP